MRQPPTMPDFTELIGFYEQYAADMAAQAEQVQAALAQAGVTLTRPGFELTVTGVQVTALRFTDAAASASPVQLREDLLDAYAEGLARANAQQAGAVGSTVDDPELAAAIRGTVSEDVRARTAGLDLADPSGSTGPAATGPGGDDTATSTSLLDFLSDPGLDDELVTTDLHETMSDVDGWAENHARMSDPSLWQYELEQQLQRVSERAGDLAAALEQISAERSSRLMAVTVNGAGRLLDLLPRAGFAGTSATELGEEFQTLYAEATAEASQAALATLRSGSEPADDDPTLAWFGQVETQARTSLAEASSDDADRGGRP